MNGRWLFEAVGHVGGDLIEEALDAEKKSRVPRHIGRYLALAACVCLVIGAGFGLARSGIFSMGRTDSAASTGAAEPGDMPDGADTGSSAAASSDTMDGAYYEAAAGGQGGEFSSYSGPILPLTLGEENENISAEREIALDISGGADTAAVTDTYRLMNHSGEDQTVTLAYPFVSSLLDMTAPTLTADSVSLDGTVRVGAFTGTFVGADLEDYETGTWNILNADSWEDYRDVLASGEYLSAALAPEPALDIPVTLYTFSDAVVPDDQQNRAATVALFTSFDAEKTTVLTYNLNGYGYDESTGERNYNYFVREWDGDAGVRVLAVLGDDLAGYEIRGYNNGSCEESVRNDAISATVTRSETTLGALLMQLCENQIARVDRLYSRETNATAQLLYRAVSEAMGSYGFLSGGAVQRYDDGRLDDIISDALSVRRVLYVTGEVTIPAGGSVSVAAAMEKPGSFNFYCGDDDETDLYGYDALTQAGSNLRFTAQSASLALEGGVGAIELVSQDFGFDPAEQRMSVPLDIAGEHHSLTVRGRE